MRRFLSILVLTLVCATPPAASARPFNEAEQTSYQIGLSHWGVAAPCNNVQLEVVPATAMGDAGAAGEAWWCAIRLRDTYVDDPRWTYQQKCQTVVHEVGHLLGHGHTDEPGNIMSPSGDATVPGCHAEALRRATPATPQPVAPSSSLTSKRLAKRIGRLENRRAVLRRALRSRHSRSLRRKLRSVNRRLRVARARVVPMD